MKLLSFTRKPFVKYWTYCALVVVLAFAFSFNNGLTAIPPVMAATGNTNGGPYKVFLPAIYNIQAFALSGLIVDQNANPVPGLVVLTDKGDATTTGADGTYTFTSLLKGTYTISLQYSNRYFSNPTSQLVALTADTTGVDFTAMPSKGEYIYNGGFEDSLAWEINSTPILAAYSTLTPHNGLRVMQAGLVNGATNAAGYTKFRQTVPIPNNVHSAQLSFWMYPTSNDNGADFQYVYVSDQDGTPLQYLVPNQRRNDAAWIQYSFDLSQYAGRYIKIVFGVYNDGTGGITGMLIDDVSLLVTP